MAIFPRALSGMLVLSVMLCTLAHAALVDVQERSSSCKAAQVQVQIVKSGVAHPVYFCTYYLLK